MLRQLCTLEDDGVKIRITNQRFQERKRRGGGVDVIEQIQMEGPEKEPMNDKDALCTFCQGIQGTVPGGSSWFLECSKSQQRPVDLGLWI